MVKEEVAQLLERLSDDCSIEDIQYHLYVLEKIRRGAVDAEQGRTLSHEDGKASQPVAHRWHAARRSYSGSL